MQFGTIHFTPVEEKPELVAAPTWETIQRLRLSGIFVGEIDESLADTAAFCETYQVGLDASANCVIVEAKRAGKIWHAACIVLATTKVDVNGVVRRHLEASKTSFAAMDNATKRTGMLYGGITPIGLPDDWPILIDARVCTTEHVIVGSGLRKSKILAPGALLATLPNATVMDIIKE